MSPLTAIAILVALVVVVTAVGLLGRARTAAARAVRVDTLPEDVVPATARGESATLVQFSTQFCGSCPGVARALNAIASDSTGVAHVDVDITDRPDVAARLHILQTPTVLLLDSDGTPVTRFTGAAPRRSYQTALTHLLERASA